MRVHLIGIGGIGVSALAQYYLAKGREVSGSDLARSEITDLLDKKGAEVFIGQKAKNISQDIDLVVYSPAVQEDNPELKQARKLGIKCQTYPEALGDLTKKHFTIAVAGTHGKSTTSSMLAMVLIKAGLDPTVIIGTKLKEFGNSNFRIGKSKYLIIEACEYEESFLNYLPKIIVLTNIEADHLDYFKNLKNVLKAFRKFIKRLSKNGVLVINEDDKNIFKILDSRGQVKFYSIKDKESQKLERILKVPGEHNVYNALAALTVARILKVPDKTFFKALSGYKGCWRRFEIKKLVIGHRSLVIVSDYAHHPTEVKATLKAGREKFLNKKIWCVFQPHQYHRTYHLFPDFVKVFSQALEENWIDNLIIADIYDVAGREDKKTKGKVSSEKLIKAIKNNKAIYIPSIKKVENYLKNNIKKGEVVIIMGAGDIYKVFHS
ncbi:UDP-N-acetylmuramate--L-alanine ligase [Candidatus Parcubacteria bacterium]|nr:UDP-N-acetylmuramate--L-alanine ligase [Candidatus Parcubacteria bacterium]